jgi:hypothetical protein
MKASSSKEWEFSLFYNPSKGLFNCTPLKAINLENLFEIYQSQYLITKSKELSIANEEQKVLIKNLLPYITYSGTYSYRNNQSILSYNSSLLPIDIDGLSEEDAINLQFTLSIQKGCIMSIVSPRGKGVKALFYLANEIELENHYSTLSNNVEYIAKQLNIEDFAKHIDVGQWKLSQPFFVAYSKHHYFNIDAQPTNWLLKDIPKMIVEYIPPKSKNHKYTNSNEQKRIEGCIINEASRLENFFAGLGEGDRHKELWRVGSIASNIHYAPQLDFELERRLYCAVVNMYKSENEAKSRGAIRTFTNIWNEAKPKNNDLIEKIIEDEYVKRQVEKEREYKELSKCSINNLKSLEQ